MKDQQQADKIWFQTVNITIQIIQEMIHYSKITPQICLLMCKMRTHLTAKGHTLYRKAIYEMDQNTNMHNEDMKELILIKHVNEQLYTCQICGKNLDIYRNFHRHLHLHSVNQPFKCSMCEKHFPKSSALKQHNTVNTGEKAYVCIICGKGLTQAQNSLCMRAYTLVNEK